MTPEVLEITSPEEFCAYVEREFKHHYAVSLRPSYDREVDAILWIQAPEDVRHFVQARAARLCAEFHDRTRTLIVPVTVPTE